MLPPPSFGGKKSKEIDWFVYWSIYQRPIVLWPVFFVAALPGLKFNLILSDTE